MGIRKSKKVRRRQLTCKVAVEISREELKIVIVDAANEAKAKVRGHQTRWLHDAPSIDSEQGVTELATALRRFGEQEKLQGGTVNVALSSDFCVTRVVAGETDRMMSELRNLRERSAHYLSLGAGPKVVSECIRALDVKNSQAWLTVTNRQTLDRILQAFEEAGLFVGVVEHSMVAVARAVGKMGGDVSSPAIVIEPSDRGVDLGISYRGQLLFDYRPGGIHSKEHIADIVEKHLERIQRYSTRFFRFASGQIHQVYLVGHSDDVEFVRAQFDRSTRLQACALEPAAVFPKWDCDLTLASNPGFLASLGATLIDASRTDKPSAQREHPDLMDFYRIGIEAPVWPEAKRHLWPVAAAAVVGALVYGGAMLEHGKARSLEGQLAAAEAESATGATLKLEMETAAVRTKYLKAISQDLVNPPLHQLVADVVRNKPAGVYMNKVTLDADRNLLFLGCADTTDLVYELENQLKSISLLQSVAIAGMSPEKLPTNENATGFQIKCKFAGIDAQAERKAGNG